MQAVFRRYLLLRKAAKLFQRSTRSSEIFRILFPRRQKFMFDFIKPIFKQDIAVMFNRGFPLAGNDVGWGINLFRRPFRLLP
ncbi:hypothetical protein EGS38_09755 [Neisseria chenwenguii]|nr:hypothetical protein EGS38_09755 [Neisseria chenwenguii]